MPTETSETERKYDAGHDARVPEFTEIPGVEQVTGTHETFLEAVYFDTQDKVLSARRITLRRRTGGADEGWHLKLPLGPDERREIRAPLGQPDVVPRELRDRLAAYTRGRELTPLARLSTRRTVQGLYGPGGEHLADFADDRVHAINLRGTDQGTHWREWEIELVHATAKFFDAAAPALTASGAVPAEHAAKIARALGDAWPPPLPSGPPSRERKDPRGRFLSRTLTPRWPNSSPTTPESGRERARPCTTCAPPPAVSDPLCASTGRCFAGMPPPHWAASCNGSAACSDDPATQK